MADSFDLNNKSRAADAAPQIPTSASEVAVRTMASDFEAMGQSGGMVNQGAPQAMQVPVTLHPDEIAAQSGVGQVPQPPTPGRGKTIVITVVIILAAAGLFALGYFVL